MVRYTLTPKRRARGVGCFLRHSQSQRQVPVVFATFRERLPMKLIRTPSMAWVLMTALALPVASVQAQSASGVPHAPLNQVLHLTASAQTEVAQDWLVITLSVQKEGLQAPAVQKQLNAMVSAALAVATPMAKPGALEVKTGEMNVSPRYGREGKMNGWVGSAQLVLQGRDVEQITTLAGRMPDLTVSQIDWRLSSEQKTAAEARIQTEAVANFQSKAQSLTKQFGFATYTLKDVRVSAQEAGEGQVMPRMAMAQMDAPSPMPVPAVAGKSRVVVNISGSIVLR
ncbi:MAG: SIMPL domain-containing protein [Comamonadaceae bacterium PBBC1]|nr:MAG: SIMPL domain-containing protein [Comamonadaceae bacterium PBBC1]